MKKFRKLTVAIALAFAVSIFQVPMSSVFALDATTTPAGVNVTTTSTTGAGVSLGRLKDLKTPTSMESNMTIKLQLKGESLSAEETKTMAQLSQVLNNLVINLETKTTGNVEKTKSDTYVKMSTTIMGLGLNIDMWIKADNTGTTPSFKMIMKVPQGLPILPAGKEYMVLDSTEFNSAGSKTPSMSLSTDLAKQLQSILFSICDDINNKFKLVSDKGDAVVKTPTGDQSVRTFELKLDDKSFKEVLSYTVNSFMTNKDFMNIIFDYMKTAGANLTDLKLPTEKQTSDAVVEINKFFDKLKDVKIVGDKGIVYNYSVNPDNYLISQNGLFDFVIDVKALDKAFGATSSVTGTKIVIGNPLTSSSTGRYLFTLEFNNVNFNINKELKIEYPTITKENSASMSEMLGSMMNLAGTGTVITTKTIEQKPVPIKKTVIAKKSTVKKPVVTKKKPVVAKKTIIAKKAKTVKKPIEIIPIVKIHK